MPPPGLHICKGITDGQIEQLIDYSLNDPVILRHTPNDAVRFGSKEKYKQWKEKGRITYVLTNDAEDLLGIVWFGVRTHVKLSHHGITLGIRLYGDARGRGYSLLFLRETICLYRQSNEFRAVPENIRGIWLETGIDNIHAHTLYTSYGFKEVERDDKRILMVEQ